MQVKGTLPEIPADAPPRIAELIAKCCALRPADRPDMGTVPAAAVSDGPMQSAWNCTEPQQ